MNKHYQSKEKARYGSNRSPATKLITGLMFAILWFVFRGRDGVTEFSFQESMVGLALFFAGFYFEYVRNILWVSIVLSIAYAMYSGDYVLAGPRVLLGGFLD